MTATKDMRVTDLSPALGAEIGGVDLTRPLDDADFAAIRAAWLDRMVVVFRDRELSQHDQERFCAGMGEMEVVKVSRSIDDDNPHILFVANIKEPGMRTVLENGEMWFHIDQHYYERPVAATVLYALEVPKTGGNTLFVNCQMAYDALPADIKSRVAGLRAINAYDYGDEMLVRTRKRPADAPRWSHPVVRTHPETGRKGLFVNRLMTESIEGLPETESDELLDFLFDHLEQRRFIYEHVWRPHDLIMWDNRCTLHARTDFDPGERRVLRRMTVKGDVPV